MDEIRAVLELDLGGAAADAALRDLDRPAQKVLLAAVDPDEALLRLPLRRGRRDLERKRDETLLDRSERERTGLDLDGAFVAETLIVRLVVPQFVIVSLSSPLLPGQASVVNSPSG